MRKFGYPKSNGTYQAPKDRRDEEPREKGPSPRSWMYSGKNDLHEATRAKMIQDSLIDSDDDQAGDDRLDLPGDYRPQEAVRPQMQFMGGTDAGSISSNSEGCSTPAPLPHGEARVVAPNVSKLSPHSAVEVRLHSLTDCVAVLCSVDVLKMRSGFFHDVLCEQEKNRAEASTFNPNVLWRSPIVVPEGSPFEAAAYLESLHEGRALFGGEWNYCWARLSVNWSIEDLMLEYAGQIEAHMNKLVSLIEQHHWRTNPSVLAGMRVALFRKGTNPLPTIVTGVCMDCMSSIGYSKLRVAFDSDSRGEGKQAAMHSIVYNPSVLSPPAPPISSATSVTSVSTSGSKFPQSQIALDRPSPIIGDVSEPLWVQDCVKENAAWSDPDDIFLTSAAAFITQIDKRMFWEMARAIIELPDLSVACQNSRVCSSEDLTTVLQRPEYRVLWTSDAPQYL
ncbi:hypothetical protein B484DRAFT_483966, partial [Ochromonadaceae sp. CCMP2298]